MNSGKKGRLSLFAASFHCLFSFHQLVFVFRFFLPLLSCGFRGLKESERGKKDPLLKFSVLGFDACLMASFDVLEAVSPYAHFVIASEDNEPGHGWNYQ